MANRVLELRQNQAALVAQCADVVNAAAKESRSMTAEETEKYERIYADAESVRKTIEIEERQAAIAATVSETRAARREATHASADEQADAFNTFVRRGAGDLTPEQRSLLIPANQQDLAFRAQSVGTTTAGGFVVPQGFYANVITALKFFGGMREAGPTVLNTDSGNDLPIPTSNDTGNTGAILGENTQDTTQDVAFAQVTMKAFKYTSKIIQISLELLQDSGVDIEAFLVKQIATRLARIQNTHFTVGTGSSQPRGVVIDATLGKTGATGQTTSITYNDLVDLKYSVNRAYRPGKWMMADSTLKACLKLVDAQSRPLLLDYMTGIQNGLGDRILGDPVIVNDDVAVMAANAKSVLYGAFDNYYVRQVMSMMLLRLVERYADFGQVGFVAFMRADGRMVDAGTHPITYYANSAT